MPDVTPRQTAAQIRASFNQLDGTDRATAAHRNTINNICREAAVALNDALPSSPEAYTALQKLVEARFWGRHALRVHGAPGEPSRPGGGEGGR